jgi:monothiol glutaredoxin
MKLEEIKQLVETNQVVLFMKGTPQSPACGFSHQAAQILRATGIGQFESRNVLEDDELRANIKQFSNWPTIPQLYVNGEFIGGSDIMMEMYQSGELEELLNAKN